MTKTIRIAGILTLATIFLPIATPAMASDQAEAQSRYSRTLEGRRATESDRRSQLAGAGTHALPALETAGPRVAPGRAARALKRKTAGSIGPRVETHDTVDFSIYDATSEVFLDLDFDGYFRGFAVTFDADVSEGVADVYAELYLSRNGGPWNLFFTTRVFSIFGAESGDEYEVVSELDFGYPSGDYDVLIELYDADTGDFLTDYGPADNAALSYLPLEDAEFDTPPVFYESHYGGGSSGPLMLVLLLLLAARQQRRRDRDALAVRVRAPRHPA